MRRQKSIYLEGCPSLPADLARIAADVAEPTDQQQAELQRHITAAAAAIRRRRAAYEREHGPIDWDD